MKTNQHRNPMKSNLESLFRRAIIGGVIVGLAAISMKIALVLAPLAILRIVVPLRALYTPDHAITVNGMVFLGKALDVATWVLVAGSLLIIIYAGFGKYCWHRLTDDPLPQPLNPGPVTKREKVMLTIILFGAVLLRTLQIDRGFSYDEMFTAYNFVNAKSFWKTISTYIVFNNHIAYSIVARMAQFLLGASEWVLRLPALLFGVIGVFAVWKFGRAAVGVSGGLLAAALLALVPLHVVYSELARGYTGMTLCVFLSSVFFFKFLASASKADVLCYISVSILAVYFHLYAVLEIGVQACLFFGIALWQAKGGVTTRINRQSFRLFWGALFAITIGCIICYLPVAVALATYIQARGRGSFQPGFPWQVVTDLSGSPGWIMVLCMMLVAFVGVRSMWRAQWTFVSYSLGIFILPLVLVMAMRPSDLYSRFFLYFLPWYALLLGKGSMVIWRKAAVMGRLHGATIRLGLLVFAAIVCYRWIADVSWNYASGPFGGYIASYRAVGQAMLRQADTNVTLCAFGEGCEELSYYAGRKLKIPRDLNDLEGYINTSSEVRCAHNVTPWDTPEHRAMARYLDEHGQAMRFSESRPCQEVVLYTIPGKVR